MGVLVGCGIRSGRPVGRLEDQSALLRRLKIFFYLSENTACYRRYPGQFIAFASIAQIGLVSKRSIIASRTTMMKSRSQVSVYTL